MVDMKTLFRGISPETSASLFRSLPIQESLSFFVKFDAQSYYFALVHVEIVLLSDYFKRLNAYWQSPKSIVCQISQTFVRISFIMAECHVFFSAFVVFCFFLRLYSVKENKLEIAKRR